MKEYSWINLDNQDKLFWRQLSCNVLMNKERFVGSYTCREMEILAYYLFELKDDSRVSFSAYRQAATHHLSLTDIITIDNLVGFYGDTENEVKRYFKALNILANKRVENFEVLDLELIEPEWELCMFDIVNVNHKPLVPSVIKFRQEKIQLFPNIF